MAHGTPTHKVILCGEYGVGKSSIFRRFVSDTFVDDAGPRSSIGLDHLDRTFKVSDGSSIKIQLWDTAGIERFATLSASYFQNASAALLCYSQDNTESFALLSQHILDIVMHTETAKIFLCGNKMDLEVEDPISEARVDEFKNQCDSVLSHMFRVSCKTGMGIEEMFQMIAEVIHKEAVYKFDPTLVQPREDEISRNKQDCCKR